jgi:hypothetical protein
VRRLTEVSLKAFDFAKQMQRMPAANKKSLLAAVEGRIARLNALKAELERMVEQCAGGSIRDCRVIEVLGDHAQCAATHN